MSSNSIRLRPLSVADLFDETIRLYRRNIVRFVSIGAVVAAPAALFQLTPLVSPALFGEDGLLLAGLIALVLLIPLIVGYTAMFAAMVHAVSEACFGRTVTLGSAYAYGLRRFLPLIGLGIVYGLVVTVLLITLIGWVYFAVAWGFAYHALLLEGLGIRASLRRSRDLVRGSFWRVLGITLLFSLFVGIVSSVFSFASAIPLGIAAAIGDDGAGAAISLVIGALIGVVGQVVLGPLTYIGWTLLYYDLRVRKEGLDLELMAQEIEAVAT